MSELRSRVIEYIAELPEEKLEHAIKLLEALINAGEDNGQTAEAEEEDEFVFGEFEFVSFEQMTKDGVVFDKM